MAKKKYRIHDVFTDRRSDDLHLSFVPRSEGGYVGPYFIGRFGCDARLTVCYSLLERSENNELPTT